MLAMYAAAVAKPTVAKTMPAQTLTAGAPLASGSLQNKQTASVSSASSTSSSSFVVQTSSQVKERLPSPVKYGEEVIPSESTTLDSTNLEMEDISEEEQGSEEEEQDEQVESQKECVDCVDKPEIPEDNEEFEVLVCGERRKVKAFTPRQHLNSSSVSGDDQDSIVEESTRTTSLQTSEQKTVGHLVRSTPVAANPSFNNPSIQVIPNQQSSQNFVTVQMRPAQIFMGQPMANGYPSPQPFPNFQPGYHMPQFQQVQMMPMQNAIHNQQLGPAHMGMPMYVAQRPMIQMAGPIIGPLPMPGPQMVMQPPSSVMRMQPHTQLHITAPHQQTIQIQVQTQVKTHQRIPVPQNFSQPPPSIPFSAQRRMIPMATPGPKAPIQQQKQQPVVTEAAPAPIRHVVHSQLYPGQRALSRPVRTPLAIVPPPAPEDSKQEPTAKQLKEEIVKEEAKNTEEQEVKKEDHKSKKEKKEQEPEDSKQEKSNVESWQMSVRPAPSVTPELNGELITAGVSVILDGPDDERSAPSNALPEIPSIALESEQDSINRVLGFTKNSGGEDFAIWTSLISEMPPRPEILKAENYEKMLELDQITAECEKRRTDEKTLAIVKKDPRLKLPAICKQMESYFM